MLSSFQGSTKQDNQVPAKLQCAGTVPCGIDLPTTQRNIHTGPLFELGTICKESLDSKKHMLSDPVTSEAFF